VTHTGGDDKEFLWDLGGRGGDSGSRRSSGGGGSR
jgi:hypothetical protein